MNPYLSAPITTLSGVGEARRKAYARLGVRTVRDLLYHFPRAFENRGDIRLLSDVQPGEKCAVVLTVSTECRISRIKGRMNLLKFRAFDDSGVCEITFFNQDYLRSAFPLGAAFRFYGKVEKMGHRYTMTSPAYEPYTESRPLPPLFSVYPLTEGLSQKIIAANVSQALSFVANMEDTLPEDIRTSEGLMTLSWALKQIHLPDDYQSLHEAKRRLAFDEFFRFALALGTMGKTSRTTGAPVCAVSEETMKEFLSALPYELTGAQTKAVSDIRKDMASDTAMSRMLVGDVGCGKTICAAAAMFVAVRSGRQAALMAPTGILASQHAADLLPLFEKMGIRGALLTGHTTPAQKKKIYAALIAEDPAQRLDVVIGTQALLSEGVGFAAPALVVTDEQHRFGVSQRAVLSEKNAHAHLLCMSATPIPRSLALVLYGDLDVSRIDEMPPGRQRVDTFVVDESYRPRLEAFIRKNVAEGGQVYVVCPAVEEKLEEDEGLIPLQADFGREGGYLLPQENTEISFAEHQPDMRAAVQFAQELSVRMPELRVAYIHGKMKASEKDQVMGDFAKGEIQVLVSTTVIEVGVNVPNACLMIVENAERFGLSQLHQLRGRVGRGHRKSYCILVKAGGGDTAKARLEVMRTTYDGYNIAEQDLAQRGPGDFLAPVNGGEIRQSGGFRLQVAEGWPDADLMNHAFNHARAILSEDPVLGTYPALRKELENAFTMAGDILN
ncbi:MAG: ATP-dependent DNA helicase RecG [Ruminococcaceae bacterium]|nr:ATP-dependent DNA helicase RecG [Oscillospiraceae bacterium]